MERRVRTYSSKAQETLGDIMRGTFAKGNRLISLAQRTGQEVSTDVVVRQMEADHWLTKNKKNWKSKYGFVEKDVFDAEKIGEKLTEFFERTNPPSESHTLLEDSSTSAPREED